MLKIARTTNPDACHLETKTTKTDKRFTFIRRVRTMMMRRTRSLLVELMMKRG